MRSVKLLLAGVGVLVTMVVAGCATPAALEETKKSLLAQMQKNDEVQKAKVAALEEKIKGLKKLVEQATALPGQLDAKMSATLNYARDVEKKIGEFRTMMAGELDRQNSHIEKIKTSYGAVLQQEAQSMEAIRKAMDTAIGQLQAAVQNSMKSLQQALPASRDTVPTVPPLPKTLKGPAAAPSPDVPKPK